MNELALACLLTISCLTAQEPGRGQDLRRLDLEDHNLRAGNATIPVQTGRLYVPENRGDPDSRDINVAFARLKSTAAEPGTPLIFLAGGPGNDATSLVTDPRWNPYLEVCDVILLDQRGIGRSQPRLLWLTDKMRPERMFLDRQQSTDHIFEVAQDARAYHTAQEVD